MNIVITGGTGFLGRRLVDKISKNNNVYVFSLSDEKGKGDVKFIQCDVRDKTELEKAFPEEIDIVYHLAANLDESDPNVYNDNIIGTKNVIELCRAKEVKQIIFMSSSGVLGETKVPAKEDFPYKPKTKYEKSKMGCEKMIISSGIPFTIIRASIIIGPNVIWSKIFDAARKQYPIIGSGKNYFHLAYVDDVVDLLILVMGNKKAINETFHVATSDTPTYEEVYSMICEELNVPMTRKHIPVFLIKIISASHLLSCKIRGKKPRLTLMKSSIERLIRNRIISMEKARKMLGFEPKYDTRKAIKETADSLNK